MSCDVTQARGPAEAGWGTAGSPLSLFSAVHRNFATSTRYYKRSGNRRDLCFFAFVFIFSPLFYRRVSKKPYFSLFIPFTFSQGVRVENWSSRKEVAIPNGTLFYIQGMILRKTRSFFQSSNLTERFRGETWRVTGNSATPFHSSTPISGASM